MALSKKERLETQAAAATMVRFRMEERRLKDRQKIEKVKFIEEAELEAVKEAERREAEREADKAKAKAKAQKEADKDAELVKKG